MRREQMDRDLLSEVGQLLHVCFVWHHRCHCIHVMKLVSEVFGLIHLVRLYIRFHTMGTYNLYININIIDNMHLICNWKGVRKKRGVRSSTAIMIRKKLLGFIFSEV